MGSRKKTQKKGRDLFADIYLSLDVHSRIALKSSIFFIGRNRLTLLDVYNKNYYQYRGNVLLLIDQGLDCVHWRFNYNYK